jgi:hypothetical protein
MEISFVCGCYMIFFGWRFLLGLFCVRGFLVSLVLERFTGCWISLYAIGHIPGVLSFGMVCPGLRGRYPI